MCLSFEVDGKFWLFALASLSEAANILERPSSSIPNVNTTWTAPRPLHSAALIYHIQICDHDAIFAIVIHAQQSASILNSVRRQSIS